MDLMNQPLLMIAGSKADTYYMTDDAFGKATNAKTKELFLINGATHIETYWKPQYVKQAVDKLTNFYQTNIWSYARPSGAPRPWSFLFVRACKQSLRGAKQKSPSRLSSEKALCPRLDSNQHAVSSATTSRWCVYQFRHPGRKNTKDRNTLLFVRVANVFILPKQF
jgi:hypothetical protein